MLVLEQARCSCVARWLCFLSFIVSASAIISTSLTQAADFALLEQQYANRVRAILESRCTTCHSTAKREGELDLEQYRSLSQLRQAAPVWQHAIEMLDTREMPPRDAPQLTESERAALRNWFTEFLNAEAEATAGDPGPVVLRRLNNVEYTNTIQQLTGQPLQPAREFPSDSAAGEGFTNTGSSLVMSPAMLGKYMNAAKQVAEHAILLPDGIRFSQHATRRDWTDDVLARIRSFYSRYTDGSGATRVSLQGLQWETNAGGRLPLAPYMAALLDARDQLQSGRTTTDQVAAQHSLNAKYMGILWTELTSSDSSLLIRHIASQFSSVTPENLPTLLAEIGAWQQSLNRFQSVGHMKPWTAPTEPLAESQQLRLKLAPVSPSTDSDDSNRDQSILIDLLVGDAGDGSEGDQVVWSGARLVAPGRRDLFVVDATKVSEQFRELRKELLNDTAKCLDIAALLTGEKSTEVSIDQLTKEHQLDPVVLKAWLNYLSLSSSDSVSLPALYTHQLKNASGYPFVSGWGSEQTPSILASSGDMHVRIPGNMRPHAVVVHPSPTQSAVTSWRSPIHGLVNIEGTVIHAHPECGNGVTWSVEIRRGNGRRRLADGLSQGGKPVTIPAISNLRVRKGELLSLVIGPREGNHACDLTDIELRIRESAQSGNRKDAESPDTLRSWSLTKDVSDSILAGNPHADGYGNSDTWSFYSEPLVASDSSLALIPVGSLADEWLATDEPVTRQRLTQSLATLLTNSRPTDAGPNRDLWDQTHDVTGPLMGALLDSIVERVASERTSPSSAVPSSLDISMHAPQVTTLRLPAELCRDREFVVSGALAAGSAANATVQLHAAMRPIGDPVPVAPSLSPSLPIVARVGSQARERFVAAAQDFRQIFPAALCYTKIVPVDEVVTLALFHREDDHLRRLMLSDADAAELDRLWQELHFVSEDLLTVEDAFEQLMQYATQDSDPKLFEHLRMPIKQRADEYRAAVTAAEPFHRSWVLEFAERAFRRPITHQERQQIDSLYERLRTEGLSHEASIRLLLVRVLVSPHFLYRLEASPPDKLSGPLSDWELASRLSYFLWSGPPDAALLDAAARGELHLPDQLTHHARRMMNDPRSENLAREFACHWLGIHDIARLDEKSERHFPEFLQIRGNLQKEAELFFTDLITGDGSVSDIFDADHTFLNEELARYYGIPEVTGENWRRVDGTRKFGRGGVLTFGATLAKQSGASRTSPILRGNWVSEVLLGERLPRPPKDVPQLPSDEANESLTVRQLVERHSSDARCANCHVRIDPFGFALEGYDAIGRYRATDLAGHNVDTKVTLPDGTNINGAGELRSYLVTHKRDVLITQFCRKLLGYALGRSVRLSDQQLIHSMRRDLEQNNYRFSVAVEAIVKSRQFMEIRGAQAQDENGEP